MHGLWDSLSDFGTGILLLGLAAFIWDAVGATPEKATPTLLTCHGSKDFDSVDVGSADVGVIINSEKRTVTVAGYETYPIGFMNDATIYFDNSDYSKKQYTRGMGTFDRLSGSLIFTSVWAAGDGSFTQSEYYDLRCKPTQRLY